MFSQWISTVFLVSHQLVVSCMLLDGDGRLTGKDAIEFFAMSNLSKPELKQVLTSECTRRFSLFSAKKIMIEKIAIQTPIR